MKNDPLAVQERRKRFVASYLIKPHGTEAAIAAGYSPKTAYAQANRLLKDAEIQRMIQAGSAAVAAKAEFDAVQVLLHWTQLATADPSKITRIRQLNCRHCWGVEHKYQWSERQYAEALDSAAKRGVELPDCGGGFGWVFNAAPNPKCPDCRGEGVSDHYIEDFDKLGPAERRLIAGVKRTKDGVEVKMRDQSNALDRIAQYLGMLVEKKEVTGKNGGPLAVVDIPAELTENPEALAMLYSKITG